MRRRCFRVLEAILCFQTRINHLVDKNLKKTLMITRGITIEGVTSEAGFDWQEQGIAMAHTAKGEYGNRAGTTSEILEFEEKYYLFFQSFSGKFTSEKGGCCD